ncbi:MAG: hypothetical protein AAGG46_07490, partial [Planctomycetota bacterium]
MNTPRIVRLLVLAIGGTTLLLLAGCGGGPDAEPPQPEAPRVSIADQVEQRKAEMAAKKQAAADAAAAAERAALAAEPPTVITRSDFKRGKKLEGGGYLSNSLQTGIVLEQQFGMLMMKKALTEFNAEYDRYPESHDEFIEKIVKPYGIELEELDGPYDYQYNPEDHQL